MSAISAIHAMKRELGLDETDYRSMLVRVTGKDSLRAMSGGQLGLVLDDMRAKGAGRRKLGGPYAARLQALWIGCWNLGLIDNRDDAALLSFVNRQTGIERTEFLIDAEQAKAVVEALKAMLARAGVDWSIRRKLPAWTQLNGYRIAMAQLAFLQKRAPAYADTSGLVPSLIAKHGAGQFEAMTEEDWHPVMNNLGTLIRSVSHP
jgi:hypothetical protein